eukprot:symbB.v1.2.032559.t2/scaffold3924.1/size48248/1
MEQIADRDTPDLCKTVLCWLGASMIIASELTLHATCKKPIELKEDGDEKCMEEEMIWYFNFLEGLCRCCTAIVLVDVLWAVLVQMDAATALGDPTLQNDSPRAPAEGQPCLRVGQWLPWSVALVTLYVGFASGCFEKPSIWVNCYAHFCDVACHTVITTAIIGIAYETLRACFVSAVEGSQACGWILEGYCCCQVDLTTDGLESGPVLGSRNFEDFQVRQGPSWVVVKWLIFLGVAVMYVKRIQDEDHFPRILEMCFISLNASCWSALAFAATQSVSRNSLRNWQRFFSATADSKFVSMVQGIPNLMCNDEASEKWEMDVKGPLVAMPGSEACQNSDLLVTTTISIVLATTMVVGTAMEKIATALAVIEPIEPNQLDSLSEPLAGDKAEEDNLLRDQVKTLSSDPSGSCRTWVLPPVSWTLPSLRFHSRGHLYQAFARFDLEVLQPTFGGPCRARGKEIDRSFHSQMTAGCLSNKTSLFGGLRRKYSKCPSMRQKKIHLCSLGQLFSNNASQKR